MEELRAVDLKKMSRQIQKIQKEMLPERTVAAYIIKHNVEDFVLQKMASYSDRTQCSSRTIPHVRPDIFATIPRIWHSREGPVRLGGRWTVKLPMIMLTSNKQI